MSEREHRLARAGEYVLGTLDDTDRLAVERDMAIDAEFAKMVDRFAAHMATLDGDGATASRVTWDSIAARIANIPQESATTSQPNTEVVSLAGRREAKLRGLPDEKPKQARLWHWGALAASLVAAVALGFGLGNVTTGQSEPTVIVLLQTPQNKPGAIFEAFADNSVRVVPLEDFVVPAGQIMQVWTLYDKSVGPVSLGTLQKTQPTLLPGQSMPIPTQQQLYEITLEPAPGSPTGKPTGPILVKGFAQIPAGA